MTRPTPSTEKERRRQELAEQMSAYESVHGPVETTPLRVHPESSMPTTERQRAGHKGIAKGKQRHVKA